MEKQTHTAGGGFTSTLSPSDLCCCKVPTEREKVAAKLREMMQDASPRDKCTLCDAEKLLEKKDSAGGGLSGPSWPWLTVLLLMMGIGTDSTILDPTVLRSWADLMEKDVAEKGVKTDGR